VAGASQPNRSFDGEEDLDTELAEELGRLRSVEAWRQLADHMDLVWKISRVGGLCAERGVAGVGVCCDEVVVWCRSSAS